MQLQFLKLITDKDVPYIRAQSYERGRWLNKVFAKLRECHYMILETTSFA